MSTDADPFENWADEYDSQSLKCQWHVPALLFGMMYGRLSPGKWLLDLGIGTGLGTLPFHKAGLKVIGLDRSPAMLDQCGQRNLPWRILRHDLTRSPWPLNTDCVDHVISTGVTHFIGDLRVVVSEVARVMKAGGLLGFDFHEFIGDEASEYSLLEEGVYQTYDAEEGQHFYRHTEAYVFDILRSSGFEVVHDTELLVSREPKKYFRVIVLQL